MIPYEYPTPPAAKTPGRPASPMAGYLAKPPARPPLDYPGLTAHFSNPATSSYLTDPALLETRARTTTNDVNADSGALRARQQLLAQLGDPGLARTVLGEADPTLGAVSANPDESTSALARLARNYRSTVNADEGALNKDNLFYSSKRGQVLQDDARDYATSQADTISKAQVGLDTISSGVAATHDQGLQQNETAMGDAFSRMLQAIAANPETATPGSASPLADFLKPRSPNAGQVARNSY